MLFVKTLHTYTRESAYTIHSILFIPSTCPPLLVKVLFFFLFRTSKVENLLVSQDSSKGIYIYSINVCCVIIMRAFFVCQSAYVQLDVPRDFFFVFNM